MRLTARRWNSCWCPKKRQWKERKRYQAEKEEKALQESKSRPFLAKAALSCLSHLLFHLTYVMAFLQCMQAITRISIAFGRLNIYMWKTDLSWKDALRQYGRSPVEKLPEPFYLIPAYWSITNQAFHLPATTKKLLPSMVGSCCWVALLSRLVSSVCLCVPLQPLLCVHTDTETRVHRDVRILTHTTQVTDIVSLTCANIFLSIWLFQCLRTLDQDRKSCVPAWNWGLPPKNTYETCPK